MSARRRSGVLLVALAWLSGACALIAGIEEFSPPGVIAPDAADAPGNDGASSSGDATPPKDASTDRSDAADAKVPFDTGCPAPTVPAGEGCVEVGAPRPIAPMSTAHVTRRKPTLKWELPSGADGAEVELCRDRACSDPILRFQASGASGAPPSDLPPGTVFWRVRGAVSGVAGTTPSATWQLVVGHRDTPIDSSYGNVVDVNGDGFADVLVGAYTAQSSTGRAHVYHGSAAGLPAIATTNLACVNTASTCGWFGLSVSGAGDVNGDGFGDVIVGAAISAHADSPGVNKGSAHVFLGSALGLDPTQTIELFEATSIANAAYGFTVAGVGDLNGDGFGDVAVGEPEVNLGKGHVYIYLGGPNGTVQTHATVLDGLVANLGFGTVVAPAGDVDGDGFADIVVGTFGGSGAAYVFRGAPTATGIAPGLPTEIASPVAGGFFGWSVGGAGDLNGDGYSDIAVGARFDGAGAGRAYVYYGSSTGIHANVRTIVVPPGTDGAAGLGLSGAGDIDGDGFDDLLVGAPGRVVGDAGTTPGRVYLFRGNASGLGETAAIVAQTLAFDGGVNADEFGIGVSGGGDVDRDGVPDVIVGARCAGGPFVDCWKGATNPGRAYFFQGNGGRDAGPLVEPTPRVLVPPNPGAFGFWVALGH